MLKRAVIAVARKIGLLEAVALTPLSALDYFQGRTWSRAALDRRMSTSKRFHHDALFSNLDRLADQDCPDRSRIAAFYKTYRDFVPDLSGQGSFARHYRPDLSRQADVAYRIFNGRDADRSDRLRNRIDKLSQRETEPADFTGWLFLHDHLFDPAMPEGAVLPDLFQFWDRDIPDDVAALTREWRDLVGSDRYRLFEEDEARSIVADVLGADSKAVWDTIPLPAVKADLFRLARLFQNGGVYVDADLGAGPVAERRLRQLAGRDFYYQRTDRAMPTISNMLIGARPGTPVIANALDTAYANISRDPNGHPLALAGPAMLTREVLTASKADDRSIALPHQIVRRDMIRGMPLAYKKTDLHWIKAYTNQSQKR
ncbi:glycosyltransferase [Maritimibacter dapengensis]|uniref:Glycosyltransferase sugar-binding region containing DXD motif-containing protein n=1 Tax=Maritimibacter dapengensis TaxID=2836868 RepID=A0ABS6SXK0_9RHOB|nr:glycosyltransferase [Maritimibacter dapengensis]MBV7377694.1 hypothetical protein [Maritimibacter dapengensis]